MPCKLYIGNLSFQAADGDLEEFFAQAGTVISARVVMDRFTNRPRGFGFVEMANDADAQAVIQSLNGRQLAGRPLTVNEARERPPRSGGGGFGGGFGGGDRGPRGGGGGRGGRRGFF